MIMELFTMRSFSLISCYFITASVFNVFVAATEEPFFSKRPEDVSVVEGNSVTLPCEVSPDFGMAYYWELNGSKISNTTRRFQRGSNLHITRVDRERDSGQFTCIAEDVASATNPITSSAASLNIQWIGEASVQLQEPDSASYIERGREVILRCHLDATGDVQVEWFRNTDRLMKTNRIDIKKKRLHIKDVQPSDNGIYRCTARNQAGHKHSVKNFALAVAGDQTALIQVVPSEQLVKKGSTAHFDCVYQNYDGIEWFFKDIPLTTNNRITIHSNGSLHVSDVQESDQGLYKCVGIKSESPEVPQIYTAELKLAYLKSLTTASFEPTLPDDFKQVVALGSLFQLTCLEPDSLPPAKKWWLSPAGHTVSDTGKIRVDDDGRLIIDKVELENAGKYTCVAENIAGKTEKAVQLIVTSKPVITLHPMSVAVDEGKRSVLTCGYSSESENYTVIRWRKDGKILKHDDDGVYSHQRIKIFKQNGTLIIYPTLTSDRGEYICEVITTGFKAVQSKPATISVIEQLKFSPPPVNKRLELGSVTRVHCKAQGTPPPIIHWEKNGKTSESFNPHIIDTNGTLQFNGVQAEDKGQYVCIASNSQGTINVTITIDVVVAPKFSVLPKNPTEALEGQSVMIDCVVEGDPKPTIQWDRNLKLNDLDPARFTVMENGTLYIKEVRKEDEDKYGCTAGSSAGLNRKEVLLIVHMEGSYHPDGDSAVTKAVLITMSVAGAYIILVIGLMVWCRYRRRSRKLPMTDSSKTENGDVDHELKDGVNGHIPGSSKIETNGIDSHKEGQKSDGAETANSHSSSHSKKSKSNYDKLALSRTHLKGITFIGRGEFGDVMVAKISKTVVSSDKRSSQVITPSGAEDKEIPVLVKQLTHTKDEQCLTEFKREIDMFAKVSHENIIKLFGLCRETEPHYMIMEHTDWGDLKQFLVATKKGNPPPLTSVQCVAIIQQIGRGMDYLSSSRFIHKDLAARNCLVTSTLIAKVGMPRLTREPYSQEYSKHMNQIIPLRWLPYEVVYEDEYSTKSDIYAFGVVIWEIFNQGELPFPKMNDTSLLNKLKDKKLEWKQHSSTPEGLQKIQESCVDVDPQSRPGFSQLVKEIEEILKSM